MPNIPPIRFTVADVERASDAYNFNCGLGALCAVLGKTPDELRPHLLDFEAKGYTNPTLMFSILRGLGVCFQVAGPYNSANPSPGFPMFGLARIQWGGPWCKPGVPMRARYRQTHWVASANSFERGVGIFDVNAIDNGSGWTSLEAWRAIMVPWILKDYPRADGTWWITHAIELGRAG